MVKDMPLVFSLVKFELQILSKTQDMIKMAKGDGTGNRYSTSDLMMFFFSTQMTSLALAILDEIRNVSLSFAMAPESAPHEKYFSSYDQMTTRELNL